MSGTIRTEHGTPKGYYLHQFADAFERYLDPPRGIRNATTPQCLRHRHFRAVSKCHTKPQCGG